MVGWAERVNMRVQVCVENSSLRHNYSKSTFPSQFQPTKANWFEFLEFDTKTQLKFKTGDILMICIMSMIALSNLLKQQKVLDFDFF